MSRLGLCFGLLITLLYSLSTAPVLVQGTRSTPGASISERRLTFPFLGKKHGGKGTECETQEFRQSQLTMIREMPFIGLFDDIKGQTKYEASGMTTALGSLWIVFDNLHALGRVNEQFQFRDERNKLVGAAGEDSQFEGLSYVESTGHFYAVEEVADHDIHGLSPYTHEIELTNDGESYTLLNRCPIHFQLEHQNKGFEGIHYYEDEHGHKYLFGLCEGNHCAGGREGRDAGNGRIVVSEYNGKDGEECGWDVVKKIKIPSTANFDDYSGMAVRGNRMAIISQENSAMWVGTFDFEKLEFTSDGAVYNFPRDNHCEMIYCNVEGIQWLDDVRIVIASDKAKKDQPYRCVEKEQRVHIFALPEGADVEPSVTDKEDNNENNNDAAATDLDADLEDLFAGLEQIVEESNSGNDGYDERDKEGWQGGYDSTLVPAV